MLVFRLQIYIARFHSFRTILHLENQPRPCAENLRRPLSPRFERETRGLRPFENTFGWCFSFLLPS